MACISTAAHLPASASQLASNLVQLSSQLGQSSTQMTYYQGIQRFVKFVDQVPVPRHLALPLGPSERIPSTLVQLFVVWAKDHYALSTIQNTLSALSSWHVSKGLPPSSQMESEKMIRQVYKAVQRQLGPEGHPRQKKGLSLDLLKKLVDKLYSLVYRTQHLSESLMHLRDLIWVVLSYFGFLRRSEAVALNVVDITLVLATPSHIQVFLRRSKTDPLGRGMQVLLAWCTASGIYIGPLVSLYLQRLQAAQYPASFPLFMGLGLKHQLDCSSPRRVAKDTMSSRLRLHLSELARELPHLQIDHHSYSSHSLRRGAATAAWQAKVPREIVARHGRWHSDAVDFYLVADIELKLTITLAL